MRVFYGIQSYTLMASSALTDQFTASTDAVFFGEAEVGDYKTVTNRIPTDGKSAEFLRMNVGYNSLY